MPDTPRDHRPRPPRRARGPRYPVADLVVGAIATRELARIASKDSIAMPLRAPSTEHEGPIGSAEVDDTPRPEPGRPAVGELLTCPSCLPPRVATTYVAGLALHPRVARARAATSAVVAGSDVLQHAWARVRTDAGPPPRLAHWSLWVRTGAGARGTLVG